MSMQRLHESISERIGVAMRSRGVSQVWLAQQIGLTASTVNRKLTGHVGITLDDLDDIARALDVPIGDLLSPRSALSSSDEPTDPYGSAPDWSLDRDMVPVAA